MIHPAVSRIEHGMWRDGEMEKECDKRNGNVVF